MLELYLSKVSESSESELAGKTYARVDYKETLTVQDMARHMAEHNGSYRTSTIKGVIEEMVECLVEMVSQGVGVKLDGLGTFYPTFESEGAETQEEFDVNKQLKGIHLRFLPEGTKDEELTSRKMKDKVILKREKDEDEASSTGGNGGGTTVEEP